MQSIGASRPRCTLCDAGADVHCHADTAFFCATCHAQARWTSSRASHHRLTSVQPKPNHVRAEVSARAMDLEPWVARLRAAAAGSTRVPPPNDVRTEITTMAMDLNPGLRAYMPPPNDVCTEITARAMGLDPWAARLRAAAAGSMRVPPPKDVHTEVTARAMGLDPSAVHLRAAEAGRMCVPPPSDVRGRCGATLLLLARRVGLDVGSARMRAAAAFHTLRVKFAAAPRMPLRVAMAAALWREVAAHGVQPVAVATAIGGARQVRTAAVDVEEDSVNCVIGEARQVSMAAVEVEEDSVDCAIMSPRRIPQELCLFV
ncbi:hypothetical protein VPH35_084783 [Triticum aestivum]